ncbi:MAG: glycosyltransferase family 4 protein [Chthoniobacteraceae bacterium]
MKILLSSHFFHPSVGGIERVSYTLAQEFIREGHEVIVVTTTREEEEIDFPLRVVRRPFPRELIRLVQWCDVYFHNNISLQTAWPLLFIRKPWVVAHHTWITRVDGRIAFRDRIKQWVSRSAKNISVSKAMAKHISGTSVIIGNPYSDAEFRKISSVVRERELIFLGRLVWDKGMDLLVEALHVLKKRGLIVKLNVVGDGPELRALRQQVQRLGLEEQVAFLGTRTGLELMVLLNAHKIIMVPSRWQEPFGLVALEGIACGCVAVGAECGGLPDAIGAAGTTFACGDVGDMAFKIAALLSDEATLASYRAEAKTHLRDHTARIVARKYLDVLEDAVR